MTDRVKLITHSFSIAWGDMDALGHVNNAKYFDYFQEARILALREMNLDLLHEQGPILLNASCTFLKPIIYPATISVEVYAHTPGKTSFIMDYDIIQNNSLMAKGESKIVWVDYNLSKSTSLPTEILNYFN